MKGKKIKLSKALSVVTVIATLISTTSVVPTYATELPHVHTEETPHVHTEESVPVQGKVCYMNGDVNADGTVTEDDALYLLYHSVYPEDYPLDQNGNMDGDANNSISVKDAYHLLNYKDDAAFTQMVHIYDEPIVSWNISEDYAAAKAIAKYKCACGSISTCDANATIVGELMAATCTGTGSVTYEAVLKHNGTVKTVSKTVEIAALGHHFAEGARACIEGLQCDRQDCGYQEIEPHNYGESGPERIPATCTEPAKEIYTCEDCGHRYENLIGAAAGHTLEEKTGEEAWVLVEGEPFTNSNLMQLSSDTSVLSKSDFTYIE